MSDMHLFSMLSRLKALYRALRYYIVHMFRYPKAEDPRLEHSQFQ